MATNGSLMSGTENELAEGISRLAFCNPFLPERIELEKAILGTRFQEKGVVWSAGSQMEEDAANLQAIEGVLDAFADKI